MYTFVKCTLIKTNQRSINQSRSAFDSHFG